MSVLPDSETDVILKWIGGRVNALCIITSLDNSQCTTA